MPTGGPCFGRLAGGPPLPLDIMLFIIRLACPCSIFAMFGNLAATISRCFFVSGWCSCQEMMLG